LTGGENTSGDGSITIMPCFVAGTLIAAAGGETPVERLAVGDTVRTACGIEERAIGDLVSARDTGLASVKWIGHRRVECRNHPKPQGVWPVRVRSGAFGDGVPRRDLWLSPDHAAYFGDGLIPIKRLINGMTIEQAPMDDVTYYHVELSGHDVLLAEGLPAESCLDTGDRCNFANGGGAMALHPDFAAHRWDTALVWEALGCARPIVTGPELHAARMLVNSRAAAAADAASAARWGLIRAGHIVRAHPGWPRGAVCR
jgi:Hint domain